MSDLDAFLATPIVEPLDPERAAKLISAPPFVLVPGVANFRDIGGWPVKSDGIQLVVRKGRLYRAATLNLITPEGKKAASCMGVGAVFDLRTLHEVRKHANVAPGDLDPRAGFVNLKMEGQMEEEGIYIHHIPLVDSTKVDPKVAFAKLVRYGDGDEGFLEGYEEMLKLGGQSYGTILRYIIQQAKEGSAGQACLWHCYAGKDRTGVFSALVLEASSYSMKCPPLLTHLTQLLGVFDEDIARDYALTRLGLEPARPALLEEFKDLIASHPDVVNGLSSSTASVMIKFLGMLRTKYGGARGYFKTHADVTDEDLDLLCASLSVEGTRDNY